MSKTKEVVVTAGELLGPVRKDFLLHTVFGPTVRCRIFRKWMDSIPPQAWRSPWLLQHFKNMRRWPPDWVTQGWVVIFWR